MSMPLTPCSGCELCDEDIAAETARTDAIVAEEWAEQDEVQRQARVIDAWILPAPARETALRIFDIYRV